MERNIAHEGNRIPDNDTGNVEEQVGKSDLHTVNIGEQTCQDTSEGGSNVSPRVKGNIGSNKWRTPIPTRGSRRMW